MSITATNERFFEQYSLKIKQGKLHTSIKLSLFTETVNTSDIPATYSFLQKTLPSILKSTCYNYEHLPFFEEVKNTEIGHLFEHILLEYLCKLKIQKGYKKATYKGITCWNWQKDPKGTFHIKTNVSTEDADILPEALRQSTILLNILMKNSKKSALHAYKQETMSPVYMMMG